AEHLADKSKAEGLARQRKLDPNVLTKWRSGLETWAKTNHPVFAIWAMVSELNETNFAVRAAPLLAKLPPELNPRVREAFAGTPPQSIKEVAERYGKILATAD